LKLLNPIVVGLAAERDLALIGSNFGLATEPDVPMLLGLVAETNPTVIFN
jgi:hypothetical protein